MGGPFLHPPGKPGPDPDRGRGDPSWTRGAAAGHVRGAEVRSGPPHRLCHALPAAGVPGQLLTTLDELKSSCVTGAQLAQIGEETEGLDGEKLRDLGLIFGAYEAMTARGPLDPRDKLTRLAEKLRTTPFFQGKDVYLDGFTDFTPQQDLVLEAIVENLDVKKSLFQELDGICKADTIFATNTSSISITAIAAATQRADRFIGMHFFDPATVMKLVEVIRGAHTSDETYKTIAELAAAIGKEPVEVNEAPGFVVNKILVPMINEGIDLVYTGVASVEGVDTA